MKNFTPSLLFLLVLTLAFQSRPAAAHKVRIFAYGEGDKIVGETAFSGGRHPQNAEILVTNNADGKVLASCRTDEQGNFSLPIPAAARRSRLDLKLILKAGEGHQGTWLLEARDYLDDSPATTAAAPPVAPQPAAAPATATPPAPLPASIRPNPPTGIDPEQLRQIVDQELDRKLAPLKRILLENQDQGPSLQEILGGIGYLLGLAGIAAYFKSKSGR
jgi:nickel transport protein